MTIKVEKRLICYFLLGTSDAGIMKKAAGKMKLATWPSEGAPVGSSCPIPSRLTKDDNNLNRILGFGSYFIPTPDVLNTFLVTEQEAVAG